MQMRIAITQRIIHDENHGEQRDALAKDWHQFLGSAFPEATIVPMPNIADRVMDFLATLEIDALILTGGDDICTQSDRDQSEINALEFASARGCPVLGVCRGFQFMVLRDSGEVSPADKAFHVATRHPVRFLSNTRWGWEKGTDLDVNSFHGFAIDEGGLPKGWSALATSVDGYIEAACSVDGRLAGIMWHPEREPSPTSHDIALFRLHLTGKGIL